MQYPKNKGFFDPVLAHGKPGKKKDKTKVAKVKAAIFGSSASAHKSKVLKLQKGNVNAGRKGYQVAKEQLVVAHGAMSLGIVEKGALSNPNPRIAGPFHSADRILLVGEGSFSFASALCTVLGGENIVASSLDTMREVAEKYAAEGQMFVGNVRSSGARTVHGIDATSAEDLRSCLGEWANFDAVAFNFPHLGGGTKEAIKANQELISGYMEAAKSVIRPPARSISSITSKKRPRDDSQGDESNFGSSSRTYAQRGFSGLVMVTLRSNEFYDKWRVEELGERAGFKLLRKVKFDKEKFKGYKEVRTNPGFRTSPEVDNAFIYVFAIVPETKDDHIGTKTEGSFGHHGGKRSKHAAFKKRKSTQ